MADRSLLYSIQNDILIAIKKILRNLRVEKACNKTQNYFEKHDHDLETLWKDFCNNHEKLKNEGTTKRDLYFKSEMFGVAEGVYKTTKAKLHQMHQYYKLTKFPLDEQGSSQKHEIEEKKEIEESIDVDNSKMETEMNPVKLLENSDVATISDGGVMNIEETSNGVEFLSVELLLNELSVQTTSTEVIQADTNSQKLTKKQGNKDLPVLELSRMDKPILIQKKSKPKRKIQENIDLSILELFDDNPDGKVRCPVGNCSTYMDSKEKMIRHLRVHNGEMPFQCNFCDYATYNSTRIKEHINTHSGVKPYKCSYCKFASVSKKYLKQHEAKHCKCICGFISKNRSHLAKHQEENCPIEIEKKPNKYKCKYCEKTFSTRALNRAHRQDRGECPVCDDFVCGLAAHMLENHGISGEIKKQDNVKVKKYKFVCKTCGWKGGWEQRVLLHLIHHPQDVDDDIDVTILKKYNIL